MSGAAAAAAASLAVMGYDAAMANKLVDRRRDMALVFLLLSVGGLLWNDWGSGAGKVIMSWPGGIVSVLVLVAISLGLWRAKEWSRWVAGVFGVLASASNVVAVSVFVQRRAGTNYPIWLAVLMALAFAIFWAAVAAYLLRPSTGRLFAKVRGAGSHNQPVSG